MTTIYKGSTNGGANRFFVKDDKIMVAGADVKGRQEVDLELLEDVWSFDTKSTGNITGDLSASQIRVFVQDDGDAIVKIGGAGIGGSFTFEFKAGHYKDVNVKKLNEKLEDSDIRTDGSIDSKAEGAAINFALFLEEMLEADAFEFIEAAGADPDKFSNPDEAIDGARVRDSGDVIFAGAGVSGRTTTDDFSSQGAAESFIDTIQLANSQNGFLDDMLI
jgi:hypothetical protein